MERPKLEYAENCTLIHTYARKLEEYCDYLEAIVSKGDCVSHYEKKIEVLEKALDKACELLEKHRIGTTCDEENYKKCMENHCFNSCIHLRNMTKEECKEWCMKDE